MVTATLTAYHKIDALENIEVHSCENGRKVN